MKLFLICLVIAICRGVESASPEPNIEEAVQLCEREVPRYCISTTCPQFCNVLRTAASRRNCNTGCTASNRCAVKANVASRTRGNEALDAQNQAQLFRCIAQTRDPNLTKTGLTKEDVPWKQLQTPTFKHAIRP